MAENSLPIEDDELLLHALADGELDAAAALALERRVAAEPALASALDRIIAVKDRMAGLERPPVSAEFLARITALGSPRASGTRLSFRREPRLFEGWRAIAATVVITAALASGVTVFLQGQQRGFSLEDAVAGSHRRSLLAANPVDIASSDRHTVKPWLDARLGISPPAPDLAGAGYPLVGGRVDVLGSNTVPTLVYRHNEHLITVLAVPGSHSEASPAIEHAGGYNIVRWSTGGFSFWAVSDLEAAELQAFAADYRSQ